MKASLAFAFLTLELAQGYKVVEILTKTKNNDLAGHGNGDVKVEVNIFMNHFK